MGPFCSQCFPVTWAQLDDVLSKLKPDDVHWAAAIVQPPQQLKMDVILYSLSTT